MNRLVKLFSLVAVLAAAPIFAQSGLGSITGTVQDSSGGLVAGASVRLTHDATQSVRTTTATDAGLFTFPALVVGSYTITINHAGFKEKKIEPADHFD